MNDETTGRLEVRRVIRAPRQKVYEAFVNPDLRRRWWFPEEGMRCDLCEIDARVGGSYRVNMKSGAGAEEKEFVCRGSFEELSEPMRLVFTWVWEHELTDDAPEKDVETRVTVELHEIIDAEGSRTEVVILHERFHAGQDPAGYEYGWRGCLESLDRVLS